MSTDINQPRRSVIDIPFYPLLVWAYLPLKLLAANLSIFQATDGIRAIIVMGLLGLVVLLIAQLIIRNRHAAAFLCVAVIGCILAMLINHAYGLPFALVALAGFLLFWRTQLFHRATQLLNVFSLVIFIQPLGSITYDYAVVKGRDDYSLAYSPFNTISPQLKPDQRAPNIVHIMLDGYAGADVLESRLKFDNSAFINELKTRDFIVGTDVRTAYNQTLLVMASIFGGTYLDPTQAPISDPNLDRMRLMLGMVISQGALKNRLKEMGYEFLYTPSGYLFFRPGEMQKLSKPEVGVLTLSFFEEYLLLRLLDLTPQREALVREIIRLRAKKLNTYLFHSIRSDDVLEMQPPFHQFVHVLAPHPPFVISRDGELTDEWVDDFGSLLDGSHTHNMDPEKQAAYRDGYLEKLRFVNKALLPQLDELIAGMPSPKVIIVHGDHGSGTYFHQERLDEACLKGRFSPLLAIYTDDKEIAQAFRKIEAERFNLVNLYRVLMDSAFATSLGELNDRSWFSSWVDPHNPQPLANADIENDCPENR